MSTGPTTFGLASFVIPSGLALANRRIGYIALGCLRDQVDRYEGDDGQYDDVKETDPEVPVAAESEIIMNGVSPPAKTAAI
jgi:hypothetical protein